MAWNGENRAFRIESYLKNGDFHSQEAIIIIGVDVTCGHLKVQIFKHGPQTIGKLKFFITHELAATPEAMTKRVLQKFKVRLPEFIAYEGKHLNDIIFKTK